MREWETLGAVDPRELVDARLQLHWAAQAASAVGKQLLPSQPDSSEQSFQWSGVHRVLVQGRVEGERPLRSALRPSSPALLLLGDHEDVLRELPLDGRTLDEIYDWMRDEVEMLLGLPLEKPLERPGELPAHPVGTGAPFSAGNAAAFRELGRYFANLDRLLRRIEDRNPGASPVRCWPHHFDLATLILLDPGANSETSRSIGVGLSPGDGTYAEPYLYVLPWPKPEGRDLPDLQGGGRWHTEGWTGAVLAASGFTAAMAQAQRVEDFLDSAVAACKGLLG